MTARLLSAAWLVGAVALAAAAAGCTDDPPSIRMLQYSPNAGFVGQDLVVNGTFLYADQDQDLSQWVAEVATPDNLLFARTPPTPVMSTDQGITGTVSFMLTVVAPPQVGLYRFSVWLVDLPGRESNHLEGTFRIASPSPYGPMNP